MHNPHTSCFAEVSEAEAVEFDTSSRDELLIHISLQRTLIRNLYLKILELEQGVGVNPSANPHHTVASSQAVASRMTGVEVEYAADRKSSVGKTVFSSSNDNPHDHMQSSGNGRTPMATEAATVHFSPRDGSPSSVNYTSPPNGDALLDRLTAELRNVRNTLDDSSGLPPSAVEQLNAAEQQLVDAIASLADGPQPDEFEAYKAGAYTRGMSTFTVAARDKATAEDVYLAQTGKYRGVSGASDRTVVGGGAHRAGPHHYNPALNASGDPTALESIAAWGSPNNNNHHQRVDQHSHGTAAAQHNVPEYRLPVGTPSPTPRTRAASPGSSRRGGAGDGGVRGALFTADPVSPSTMDMQRRATYRDDVIDAAASPPSGASPSGPPLPLLRKLQYRLQSHLDQGGSGSGGGGGNNIFAGDDVSSIHLTTDPSSGQLVVGRSTKLRDSVTPRRMRKGTPSPGRGTAPGGRGGGGTSPTPADRVSAYRRGRVL